MVYGSGATPSSVINNGEFILTYECSNKVFHMQIVTTTKASVKSRMNHNLRETSIAVDSVAALKHNSLMSVSKFVEETTSHY